MAEKATGKRTEDAQGAVFVDIPDEVPVEEYARYWLPGWLYDVLKWVGLLGIPGFAAIYTGLASVWGWPAAGEVAQTATIVSAGVGVLLGAAEATKKAGTGNGAA